MNTVLMAIVDGPSPKLCNPWDDFTLGAYERLINELDPRVPKKIRKFDKHRFRILWDPPTDLLEKRRGEAWQRVAGVLVDGIGAEAARDADVSAVVEEIVDYVMTESKTPIFLNVGFYVYVMVSDPQTEFQIELEQALYEALTEQFAHLPHGFIAVRAVPDPEYLLKALEEGTRQMCRNYRTSLIRPVISALISRP
jgi:hypothetical protein